MSFAVASALLVGLLVVAPIAAHLLRRGRPQQIEFPAAALVPRTAAKSRKRSRLDDRLLLALRVLLVTSLAALGATPLVQCSRLSVSRTSGASVALAIVVDDSHSMRSRVEDGVRWELAIKGAQELLASTRAGDAVALVLAGRPARVALSPTTDRDAARRALAELDPSDRSTDVEDAVKIARASLSDLPQVDKRVVLLSDLAGATLPPGEPPVSVPLRALREPASNCAITTCTQRGVSVVAEVACTDTAVAQGRQLAIDQQSAVRRDEAPSEPSPGGASGEAEDEPDRKPREPVRTAELAARGGVQAVELVASLDTDVRQLRLSGEDADASDDVCAVGPDAAGTTVAIVADRARATTVTGGPTVIEQALHALRPTASLRPLTLLPETKEDLQSYATLILDDPPGFSPEARTALVDWVRQGGVAVALLGPRAPTAQLASNLTPFVEGAVQWESLDAPQGVTAASLAWLGEASHSLDAVTESGRALFGGVPTGARVRGMWQDEQPWLLEQGLDRGLLITVGLPASVDVSDFALRPAFVALFDHVLTQAESRSGPSRSRAGTTWRFSSGRATAVVGPRGELPLTSGGTCVDGAGSDCASGQAFDHVQVGLAGRYVVRRGGNETVRVVDVDPDEVLARPALGGEEPAAASSWTQSSVDVSPELALIVLCLFAAELIFRSLAKRREA